MTKFMALSDVELKDPPITIFKGSVGFFREITSDVQSAVDSGCLLLMGVGKSQYAQPNAQTTSVAPTRESSFDFQSHVVTTLSTISRQLQELTEKVDAGVAAKKRK